MFQKERKVAIEHASSGELYKHSDDFFAVIGFFNGKETLELYSSEYAERCNRNFVSNALFNAGVPTEIANQMAMNVPVGKFFVYREIFTDPFEYAMKKTKMLNLKDGDTVKDLVQGEVTVFTDPETGAPIIGIDPERWSGTLLGMINVYDPTNWLVERMADPSAEY